MAETDIINATRGSKQYPYYYETMAFLQQLAPLKESFQKSFEQQPGGSSEELAEALEGMQGAFFTGINSFFDGWYKWLQVHQVSDMDWAGVVYLKERYEMLSDVLMKVSDWQSAYADSLCAKLSDYEARAREEQSRAASASDCERMAFDRRVGRQD